MNDSPPETVRRVELQADNVVFHVQGAAANVPTAIGLIGTIFPRGRAQNYAFSCYGELSFIASRAVILRNSYSILTNARVAAAGAPLGGAFGNILSGVIANYTSWKWVFGVTAIMAGLITVAGFFLIPRPPPPDPDVVLPTVDWIGAALITVGLTALMFALTEGNVVGWTTPFVPALIVVSVVVVIAFGFWQWWLEHRSSRKPLMKMSMFGNLRFTIGLVIFLVFFAAFNNFMVFATYYYQQYQGLSPLQTSLRFIPVGLSGLVVAFIVSQLLHRVPTIFLLFAGHLCLLATVVLFASPIPPSTSYFAWGLPAMILSVMGSDVMWPCLMLSTSRELPSEDQALGGALVNAMGQFGRAIGLAVATSVQTAVMADALHVPVEDVGKVLPHDPVALKGIRGAFWLNTGLVITSLVLSIITFRNMDIIGKPKAATRENLTTAPETASVSDQQR